MHYYSERMNSVGTSLLSLWFFFGLFGNWDFWEVKAVYWQHFGRWKSRSLLQMRLRYQIWLSLPLNCAFKFWWDWSEPVMRNLGIAKTFKSGVGAPCAVYQAWGFCDRWFGSCTFPGSSWSVQVVVFYSIDLTGKQCWMSAYSLCGHLLNCTLMTCVLLYISGFLCVFWFYSLKKWMLVRVWVDLKAARSWSQSKFFTC